VILTMHTQSNEEATTGIMQAGDLEFYTIELPWRDNKQGWSCVPAGTYDLIPYNSPTHGPTWCLHNPALNVYGRAPYPIGCRSECELHSANYARQLLGCIALGTDGQPMIDPMTNTVVPAVENSRDAVAELLKLLTPMSSGHTLSIVRDINNGQA